MKRHLTINALAAVLSLLSIGAAHAITNGQPDGNNHPYVGLVLFYDQNNTPLWRCSSSLISPTLLLTAGHCTTDAIKAQVWFDAGPIQYDPTYTGGSCTDDGSYTNYPCVGGVWGTPYTNPEYMSPENPYGGGNGLPAYSYRDVGIVVLYKPILMEKYAELPTPGLIVV